MNIFKTNDLTVTTSYTIPANKGSHSVGPIKINSGVTVVIGTDARWVIL